MHSSTPWSIDKSNTQPRIVDSSGRPVVDPIANEDGMSDEDRERIVACVNACAVIPSPPPPRVLKATPNRCDDLREAIRLQDRIRDFEIKALKQDSASYKRERDEIMTALAAVINQMGGEFRLSDLYLLALRSGSFQIESRRDVDNRCTVIRVVMKE